MRVLILILALAVVGGGVFYTHRLVQRMPADPVRHASTMPTLAKVRELADLVVLDVPISDIHVSELEGLSGSLKLAVAVAGDVQLSTDLAEARFEAMDAERQTAVLVLPRPTARRPRVDHEKTRVLEIQRHGLWRLLHGAAGERELTNRAFTDAQRILAEAAKDPELVARACGQTERVIDGFFGAMGWEVAVQWDDGAAASAGR